MNQLHYNQEKSPKRTPANAARKAFWDAAIGDNSKLANLAKAAITEAERQAQAGPEVVAWPPAEDQPITLGTYLGAVEAIAKKDAALDACVDWMEQHPGNYKLSDSDWAKHSAAITKAKEARK